MIVPRRRAADVNHTGFSSSHGRGVPKLPFPTTEPFPSARGGPEIAIVRQGELQVREGHGVLRILVGDQAREEDAGAVQRQRKVFELLKARQRVDQGIVRAILGQHARVVKDSLHAARSDEASEDGSDAEEDVVIIIIFFFVKIRGPVAHESEDGE